MSLKIVLLALAACTALHAQGLPRLPQGEMENFRLTRLDAKGAPEGFIEGKVARSKRDGTVEIDSAVLTTLLREGKFVARAEKFIYTPGTETFDCPSGMEADLPDGGYFKAPVAKGTASGGERPILKFTCTGPMSLRSGTESDSTLRASEIIDPEVEVRFLNARPQPGVKTEPAVTSLAIEGKRGATVDLRIRRVPGLGSEEENQPGKLALSCFGDIDITLDNAAGTCAVSMLRRARMALAPEAAEGPARTFEVTANLLRMRGKVGPEKAPTGLTDLEIDGEEAVHLTGPQFIGFGDQLEYRESGKQRVVKLMRGPILDLNQSPREQDPAKRAFLHMKARDLISVSGEAPPEGVKDYQPVLTIGLEAGAQIWREVGGEVQYHIVGRTVGLTTRAVKRVVEAPPGGADKPSEETVWRVDAFNVTSEGYSPMLRVAGMSKVSDDALDSGQRAAVFGARAEGAVDENGILRGTAWGPDILALLYSGHSLADEMRYALRLRKRPQDENPPRRPPARPGRLEVRAAKKLDIECTTEPVKLGEDPRPLMVKAAGSVQMEHTPLPRFDADLVTLSGESLWLVLGGLHVIEPTVAKGNPEPRPEDYQHARLERAELMPAPGADCLATMGYDLLVSRGFSFSTQTPEGTPADVRDLGGKVTGPGRIVIRDRDSLAYVGTLVDRLPRRERAPAPQQPDAGWMDFGGDVNVASDENSRTLEAALATFSLVFGDFEQARAGQSAVKDLGDLIDPEVRPLYFATGRRVLLVSSGYAAAGDKKAIVNLLRLEGDALLRSHSDGVQARAAESIEATGADDQRSPGNPLAVVLLGKPEIEMDRAESFFGAAVTRGAFAYDGRWKLTAGERLEITFRPVAAGDPESLATLRADLAALSQTGLGALEMAHRAGRALGITRDLAAPLPPEFTPESEQVRNALKFTESAAADAGRCLMREAAGFTDVVLRGRVARTAARAHDLLSGLVDIAAMGGVKGEFSASAAQTPPLHLEMQRIVVSFNGLGEIADTRGEGPVTVSRASYTIKGGAISQSRDGTLMLDNAAIILPPETGVQIEGVRQVSLRQARQTADDGRESRAMVTQVTGKGLKVSIDLSKSSP